MHYMGYSNSHFFRHSALLTRSLALLGMTAGESDNFNVITINGFIGSRAPTIFLSGLIKKDNQLTIRMAHRIHCCVRINRRLNNDKALG